MEEKIANIKKYVAIISGKKYDNELLEFVIFEVLDRIQLYLNTEVIPNKIERIVADIVNTGLEKVTSKKDDTESNDQVVSSISDNGQSITFSNEVKKYFISATDEEIFGGFCTLLSRYRRIKVVYPKKNEETNS